MRSHKIRLALIATIVSAISIGLTFWALFQRAQSDAFEAKTGELHNAITLLTTDPTEEVDFADVRVLNPPISVLVFKADGSLSDAMGPAISASIPLKGLASGRAVLSNDGSELLLGTKFQSQFVVTGTSWRDSARSLSRLEFILTVLVIPISLLVGLASWFAANGIFRPLEKLSLEADAIGGSDLRQRLTTEDRAEFAQFAEHLNHMLDRIQRTVEREDRFAADAAHELRTPLAIMRTRVETALLRKREAKEHEAVLRQLLSEIDRLAVVVGALLSTARTQLQPAEQIEVRSALSTILGEWQDRLVDRGLRLNATVEDCWAEILPEELEIIVNNLLENASRFAPDGSEIKLTLTHEGELSVEDSGPGLPEQLLNSVFERFVRGDDSRNRASGGLGIGLTLVRRIVEGRGGSVRVENMPGARFTIKLRSLSSKPITAPA